MRNENPPGGDSSLIFDCSPFRAFREMLQRSTLVRLINLSGMQNEINLQLLLMLLVTSG